MQVETALTGKNKAIARAKLLADAEQQVHQLRAYLVAADEEKSVLMCTLEQERCRVKSLQLQLEENDFVSEPNSVGIPTPTLQRFSLAENSAVASALQSGAVSPDDASCSDCTRSTVSDTNTKK